MQKPGKPLAEGKTWWQRNKKKVLIVGGVAVAVVGGVLLFKNWDAIIESAMIIPRKGQTALPQPTADHRKPQPPIEAQDLKNVVSRALNGGEAYPVNGHIRNLPVAWSPSPEQRALADALGIPLNEHQTYVRGYLKNCG